MKPRALVVPALLAMAALAASQSALTLAQGFADAEAKAILRGDTAWYRKNLAPDYVETGKDGKTLTKAQSIARGEANRKAARVTGVTVRALRAAMVGGNLVTTLDVSLTGTLTLGDGKAHPIGDKGVFESTWAKRGGVWQKVKERTLSERATVDGKTFPG